MTSDEKKELLFWKIFHNKYLLYFILESVHKINIEYTEENCNIDVESHHIFNILKFKEITSLGWILKHKQFELLKCKLQAGEYIEIKDQDISDIANNIIKKKEQFQKLTLTPNETDWVLKLLLKYRPLELKQFDIQSIIFSYHVGTKDSKSLIQIIKLTSEILNYPKTSDYPFETLIPLMGSVDVLYSFLGLPNIVITQSKRFKSRSISMAFKNIYCGEEILQLLLNNDQLYTNPTTVIESTNKRFKSRDGSSIDINSNDYDNDDEEDEYEEYDENDETLIKLDLGKIFSLVSKDIQDKLINLNYFKLDPKYKLTQHEIENCCLNSPGIKIKELHKLFVIKNSSYYCTFISNYNEEIKEIQETEKNNLGRSIVEVLENELKLLKFCRDNKNKYQTQPLSNFIHRYLDGDTFISSGWENRNSEELSFFKFIYGMEDKQDYEYLVSILPPITECFFPRKWNTNLKHFLNAFKAKKYPKGDFIRFFSIVVKDGIYNWVEVKWHAFLPGYHDILAYNKSGDGNLPFKSITNISYSMDINTNYKKKLNRLPLINTINSGEVIELYILGGSLHGECIDISPFDKSEFLLNQSIENIIKLTNCLNVSNNSQNSNYNCLLIFKKVLVGIQDPNFNPLDLFTSDVSSLLDKFLYVIISSLKPNFLKLYFNNTINYNLEYYNSLKQLFTYGIQNKSFEDGIKCIEIVIGEFNKCSCTNDGNGGNSFNKYLKSLKEIINYQFELLITIRPIPNERLKYIYHLITNNINSIVLYHSLYHSFHYIALKSIKLEKYIQQVPCIPQIFHFDKYKSFGNIGYENNIIDFLNSSILTFDYIFGGSGSGSGCISKFEELLNTIMDFFLFPKNSIWNIEQCNHSFYQTLFNYNLVYFLEIKRIDLFLKHLKYIQQFSSGNNENRCFKLNDFQFSNKLIEYSCRSMDYESFIQFISFNSYNSIINYLQQNNNDNKCGFILSIHPNIINDIPIIFNTYKDKFNFNFNYLIFTNPTY